MLWYTMSKPCITACRSSRQRHKHSSRVYNYQSQRVAVNSAGRASHKFVLYTKRAMQCTWSSFMVLDRLTWKMSLLWSCHVQVMILSLFHITPGGIEVDTLTNAASAICHWHETCMRSNTLIYQLFLFTWHGISAKWPKNKIAAKLLSAIRSHEMMNTSCAAHQQSSCQQLPHPMCH